MLFVFFSSRRRHTRLQGDWSSDVCSSDLGIKFRHLAAEYRAASNDRVFHARHAGVDAEFRRAGGFGGSLEALAIVADDGEVVGVFQRDGVEIGNGQLRGISNELAVG